MKEYKVDGQQPSLLPEGKKWKLVWSDEFEGTILDRSKWSFRTNYWGYKADQFTDKGVTLDGKGCIVFKPVVEDGMVKSSQLQTGANSFDNIDLFGAIQNRLEGRKGNNPWNGEVEIWPLKPLDTPKFMHRYGYYEARVKFQTKNFWWSAFWTQSPTIGAAYNPEFCGVESDIVENFVRGDLTSGNIYGGYGKTFAESARVRYPYTEDGQFHRVGMYWSEEGYVFYFDGKETARSSAPVSKVEQFILLSTEIHGYRRGQKKTEWTDEELSDCFMCDYVRVFDEIK